MGVGIFGYGCGLYLLPGGRTANWNTGGLEDSGPVPSWVSSQAVFMSNLRDVNCKDMPTKGDVSVRGDPLKAAQPGQLEWEIDGETLFMLQDPNYKILRRAMHLQTPLALLALAGTLATPWRRGLPGRLVRHRLHARREARRPGELQSQDHPRPERQFQLGAAVRDGHHLTHPPGTPELWNPSHPREMNMHTFTDTAAGSGTYPLAHGRLNAAAPTPAWNCSHCCRDKSNSTSSHPIPS